MELNTSKFIFMLWMSCSHVVITPILGSLPENNDIEFLKGLSSDLKMLLSQSRNVSMAKDNLESFYTEWLSVTKASLESINRTKDEITQATRLDNYVSLATSVGVGVVGIVSAVTAGAPFLLVAIPSFGAGVIGVQLFSGARRYSVSRDVCNIASMYVNTSKRYTNQLLERMDTYFKAIEKFKELFKDLRGKDSTVLLIYEIARSEGFFQHLNIDKRTENELRSLLLQIIESDTSKIKPHVWILDSAEILYDGARSLVDGVRNMLSEIMKTFESDANGAYIFIEQVSDIYRDWRRDSEKVDVPLLGDGRPTPLYYEAVLWSIFAHSSSFPLKEFLETENLISLALTALIITGEVAVGTKAALNLLEGSTSVESDEIMKVMNRLADLRKEIVEKMKVKFGW